jgi:two-component system CheB/CheR fusion protein
MEKIIILLRSHTRNDFSLYKKSTLYRRVERRMGIHKIESIASYLRFVQENPQELDLLFREILIGVTSFFRDAEAWGALKELVIRPLLESSPPGAPLRAWVAGCSTGEEAYSLAIAFREVLEAEPLQGAREVQIFATDLDRNAIDRARTGFFPSNIAADLSSERLERFFVAEEEGFRVRKQLREMIIFAPHNLVMDPPFTRLDLVTCRNLLIYLSPELQAKLLPLLHYALKSGAFLFLGSAETVGASSGMFLPLDTKARIYKRRDAEREDRVFSIPTDSPTRTQGPGPAPKSAKSETSIQSLADRVILQSYAPAAVLVNGEGDILYVSGRTGRYLEPAAGKANYNVFAMARKGLALALESAFPRALRKSEAVSVRGIRVEHEGGAELVDLSLQGLDEPEALRGSVLVVFIQAGQVDEAGRAAASSAPERGPQVEALEQEIREERQEIGELRRRMQSSQEDLRSANEELQSTNEELQSTVEELMTSKEEMQSLNEELQTVNGELQAKLDELVASNNDMKNLLDSTGIATLFLDRELRVRRFTPQTAMITKLIATDVGRPVTDIVSSYVYPDLAADAAQVLATLRARERQITAGEGRWLSARVMPYRTNDDRIDGVVITYSDISRMKRLEAELEASGRRSGEGADPGEKHEK